MALRLPLRARSSAGRRRAAGHRASATGDGVGGARRAARRAPLHRRARLRAARHPRPTTPPPGARRYQAPDPQHDSELRRASGAPRQPSPGSNADLASPRLRRRGLRRGWPPAATGRGRRPRDGDRAVAGDLGLLPLADGRLRRPGLTVAGRDWARAHALEHLRPGGPLPVLRCGRQPYGLLPVTSLDAWTPAPGERRRTPTRARAGPACATASCGRRPPSVPRVGRERRPERRPRRRSPGRRRCRPSFRVRGLMGQHFLQHLRAFLGEDLDPIGFWQTPRAAEQPDRRPPLGLGFVPALAHAAYDGGGAPGHRAAGRRRRPYIAGLLAVTDPDALAARSRATGPAPAGAPAPRAAAANTPRPPRALLAAEQRRARSAARRGARRPRARTSRRPPTWSWLRDQHDGRRHRARPASAGGPRPAELPSRGARDARRRRRRRRWSATSPAPSTPTSHRLDAWITSLASRRLAELRAGDAERDRASAATAGSRTCAQPPRARRVAGRPTSPARCRAAARRPGLHPRALAEPGQRRGAAAQRAPRARRRARLALRDRADLGRGCGSPSGCSRAFARASRSARCSATPSSAACTRPTSTTSSTTSVRSRRCPAPPPPASAGSWSTAWRWPRRGISDRAMSRAAALGPAPALARQDGRSSTRWRARSTPPPTRSTPRARSRWCAATSRAPPLRSTRSRADRRRPGARLHGDAAHRHRGHPSRRDALRRRRRGTPPGRPAGRCLAARASPTRCSTPGPAACSARPTGIERTARRGRRDAATHAVPLTRARAHADRPRLGDRRRRRSAGRDRRACSSHAAGASPPARVDLSRGRDGAASATWSSSPRAPSGSWPARARWTARDLLPPHAEPVRGLDLDEFEQTGRRRRAGAGRSPRAPARGARRRTATCEPAMLRVAASECSSAIPVPARTPTPAAAGARAPGRDRAQDHAPPTPDARPATRGAARPAPRPAAHGVRAGFPRPAAVRRRQRRGGRGLARRRRSARRRRPARGVHLAAADGARPPTARPAQPAAARGRGARRASSGSSSRRRAGAARRWPTLGRPRAAGGWQRSTAPPRSSFRTRRPTSAARCAGCSSTSGPSSCRAATRPPASRSSTTRPTPPRRRRSCSPCRRSSGEPWTRRRASTACCSRRSTCSASARRRPRRAGRRRALPARDLPRVQRRRRRRIHRPQPARAVGGRRHALDHHLVAPRAAGLGHRHRRSATPRASTTRSGCWPGSGRSASSRARTPARRSWRAGGPRARR